MKKKLDENMGRKINTTPMRIKQGNFPKVSPSVSDSRNDLDHSRMKKFH